jgi:UDP-glucose 4-epimerase
MRVCVTGSQGFLGSYICSQLLEKGYDVVGIDNFSKYGKVKRRHDSHPNFTLVEHDLSISFPEIGKVNYLIAGAAMIGGISYFHKYAYDLLATNERILANTFDWAIRQWNAQDAFYETEDRFRKIVTVSSSMVFENTDLYPTPEQEVNNCPPPSSSYGLQKLCCEYFSRAAYDQYGLPYTIVRPFNCVGTGEDPTGEEVSVGNVKMQMSHVVPDLFRRAMELKPNQQFPILGKGNQVRHYTNGKDIARGIIMAMELGRQTDYNISSPVPTTVKELAEKIWTKVHGRLPVLTFEKAFEYDVQIRSPDVRKAIIELGFEAKITLDESLDEVYRGLINSRSIN